ncbi:MAG: gliding motility-associated C-terminal domain-containing protein [Saprospiraceae bacterium]|nr:gliding motility-associated C-terminal domain-containing protein [Saprospiraceae bacterium]
MMTTKIRIALLLLFATPYLYAQTSLNQGLLAVYSFDGCSDDLTASANDGTLLGEALANTALQIPGDDSSALLLNGAFLNGLTDFTIAFQVTFATFNVAGSPQTPLNTILSGANAAQLRALSLAYDHSENTFIIVINGVTYTVSGVSFNALQTYCVGIIRRNNVVDLYLDGVKTGPGATIATPLQITADALVIGQDQDCLGGCFAANQSLNGQLDNLRFYNRALAEAELNTYCSDAGNEDREEERTAGLCLGKKVLLDVTLEGKPSATYRWQDNSTDPVFEASERGTYVAEVTDCGQKVTYTFDVIREENCPCDPMAPKAFTPNGDERNDVFRILNDCVFTQFDLQIFNRWGKEVFRTQTPGDGWDGTLSGKNQPSDVYVFVLVYKIKESDQEFQKKGDITLMR